MTIRNSLLALLAEEPAHGYGLKSRFENTTGDVWRLNVGQVYTTLRRLQRDALIEPLDSASEAPSWRLTATGREALSDWYAEPVALEPPSRDELALKVLLAVSTEEVDAREVLRVQRVETMKRLQGYTVTKRDADPETQLPWCLLLDSLILKARAELDWLDLCEEAIRRRAGVKR
ncbi:MAG: PadR family transcriptional regulator [Acidobacteriota bacterium]